MRRLLRLSDADPTGLMAGLEDVWRHGDAAIVLPDEAAPATIPPAVTAALEGRISPPEGTALVVPTSGSTGSPRAIALSHGSLEAAVSSSLTRLGGGPGERWALALPIRHIAGLMVLLRSRALGTVPAPIAPGDPLAIARASVVARHVALVPPQLSRALDAGADLSGYGTVLVGGGPADPRLLVRARAAGVRVVTSYGMTETCGGCVLDGVPLEGVEVRIDAAGRVAIRGAAVASVDLQGRPLRDEDGWLTTSDRGRLSGGVLEVLGRADDAIVSGGMNVDPVAVARALESHPEVREAVVVGVPHDRWGALVRAVVVPRDGGAPPGLAGLAEHVAGILGRGHAPRQLMLVDVIPRGPLGKIARATLDALSGAAPDEGGDPPVGP